MKRWPHSLQGGDPQSKVRGAPDKIINGVSRNAKAITWCLTVIYDGCVSNLMQRRSKIARCIGRSKLSTRYYYVTKQTFYMLLTSPLQDIHLVVLKLTRPHGIVHGIERCSCYCCDVWIATRRHVYLSFPSPFGQVILFRGIWSSRSRYRLYFYVSEFQSTSSYSCILNVRGR
jgi:hypothetical protein